MRRNTTLLDELGTRAFSELEKERRLGYPAIAIRGIEVLNRKFKGHYVFLDDDSNNVYQVESCETDGDLFVKEILTERDREQLLKQGKLKNKWESLYWRIPSNEAVILE